MLLVSAAAAAGWHADFCRKPPLRHERGSKRRSLTLQHAGQVMKKTLRFTLKHFFFFFVFPWMTVNTLNGSI